jgi:hypothetical protein
MWDVSAWLLEVEQGDEACLSGQRRSRPDWRAPWQRSGCKGVTAERKTERRVAWRSKDLIRPLV